MDRILLGDERDKLPNLMLSESNSPPVWVIQDERDIIRTESEIQELEFELKCLDYMYTLKSALLNAPFRKEPLKALKQRSEAEKDKLQERIESNHQVRMVSSKDQEIMALEEEIKSTEEQIKVNDEEYNDIHRELSIHAKVALASDDDLRERFTKCMDKESKLQLCK